MINRLSLWRAKRRLSRHSAARTMHGGSQYCPCPSCVVDRETLAQAGRDRWLK